MKIKILLFTSILILLLILHFLFFEKLEYFTTQYEGLILFDIDGTLTTNSKEDNHDIVNFCLTNNYAVGISTAGSIYSMNNLLTYPWMPKNLYDFIIDNNNVTFNNVRSHILCGRYNYEPFGKIYGNVNQKFDLTKFGYAKAFTMLKTAEALNIKDPTKLILVDDSLAFLQGYRNFNKNYNFVDCSKGLSLDKIKQKLIV
jgi:hypothetical protein